MSLPPVYNLKDWISRHQDKLKPPVCNEQVWRDREFIVMVIGGPNQRTDYHVDPGEEWFYQIQGDMVLKVVADGRPQDIPIREGEMFLLPALVPHSPQRLRDTVGMVIERVRRPGEKDHLRWYCESCREPLYDAEFQLVDITQQLKPVFDAFYGDEQLRTCRRCKTVHPAPAPARA